ncbi:MAG: hypothetical protein AAB509_00195 [Patescibacteria group bacterium]
MKKSLLLLTLLSILTLPLSSFAFAELPNGGSTTITTLFNNILSAVWIIFTGVAVIFLVFAGVLFLTAQGDPTKLTTAKQAFLWGVAGVVVAIIAFSIIKITETALS